MRKLNKKGFTLIELLAVIVVLAIVLVVTIPAVLSSMDQARTKQFENAVKTLEEYMQKQKQACEVGDYDLAPYVSSYFGTGGCNFITDNDNTLITIVHAAGYTYDSLDSNCDRNEEFCELSIGSNGKVTHAKSPSDSKFNTKCYGTGCSS